MTTVQLRRPESILVIVHTPAAECLLLERVNPVGFWQSVTGTLHWDETPAQTAVREVREEEFPTEKESFTMDESVLAELATL